MSTEKDINNNLDFEKEEQKDYFHNEKIGNEMLQKGEMNNNNSDINDEENNMNNNIDIDSAQEAFVQTLNLQIKQLQELLAGKNKELDNLNTENNKLKILLIQEQKKLIDKDNNIHTINVHKKNLEEKIDKYKKESENNQTKIKELNYKIIELNQKIASKESLSQFNNQINDVLNQDNSNDNHKNNIIINEKYEIEQKRLNNLIDEFEIKNSKLIFDNKTLNNKINTIINDKNNEMNIYKSIYQNQISNLNKVINNLNNRISILLSEKTIKKNFDNVLIKTEIKEKINELEKKINSYDKENFNLKKENKQLKNDLEELKLVKDSKEKIIKKLQTDFEMMDNQYSNNIFANKAIEDNSKLNDINTSQYLNDLIRKEKKLRKENKDLKFGLKQMTKNINEANKLYFKKKADFDKSLEFRDNKLKEYRKKISLLKMKINELHQEINLLKESKGDFIINNKNFSSLTHNEKNNNNKNLIKKENKKIRCFTPKPRVNRGNNCPFEINLENKIYKNNESNENDIFRDIKISETKKENATIKLNSSKDNNKETINQEKNKKIVMNIEIAKLADKEQDLKYLKEYKDTLNKLEEQLNKFKS